MDNGAVRIWHAQILSVVRFWVQFDLTRSESYLLRLRRTGRFGVQFGIWARALPWLAGDAAYANAGSELGILVQFLDILLTILRDILLEQRCGFAF